MNKNVILTEKRPIKMWLEDIEDGALQQLKNLANLPFTFKHVCAMPDCHQGYGMPIGGVLATLGVVIPNAVGVDIGCGMYAVKTSLTQISQEDIKTIMGKIRETVPVGFKWHDSPCCDALMPEGGSGMVVVRDEYDRAKHQLGTLGGGNHFIEIQKGNDGHVWFMIHTGSRNLGKKVADYHNDVAKRMNAKYFSSVPKEHDLAFLPLDSVEGQRYIAEMKYCVDFALASRNLIASMVMNAIRDVTGGYMKKYYNIAHNYASIENHYKHNVVVHRKGATLAREGTVGIIPGSQGTKSYIVGGLGNPESFMSCSHGAGRKMGRMAAQRNLDLKAEIYALNKQGIIHSIRTKKDLDEAPSAYKDITKVMDNQKDLVTICVELQPLAVIKG